MNFTALQNRLTQLADQEGYTDLSPAVVPGDFINDAYRRFCWYGDYNLTTDTSLATSANVATYTLPGRWKKVHEVYVGTTTLRPSTEDYERLFNPSWILAPVSGTMKRFVQLDYSTLVLVPAPTAGAQAIKVRGVKQVADMTAGGDIPIIPEVFHDEIAQYACYLLGTAYAQPDALPRLQEYEKNFFGVITESLDTLGRGKASA